MTTRKIVCKFSIARPGEGIQVTPGIHHVFVVKRSALSIDVLEAEDVLFRFDSAVFLPDRMDGPDEKDQGGPTDDQSYISGLAVLSGFFRYIQFCYDRGEKKYVLITGHTDSVGSEKSNFELSKRRSEVVLALILGGPESRQAFVNHVMEHHTIEDKQHILRWVAKRLSKYYSEAEKVTISTIPKWWEVDPGKIDGVIGQKTTDAIFAFKTAFSKSFPPKTGYEGVVCAEDLQDIKDALKPGAVFGKNMWAAVFEIYQAELQIALKADGFDLRKIREHICWVDEEKKAVGCGETWPIDARGKDNYRSQSNRRVEILLYDPYELAHCLPESDEDIIDDEQRHVLPCKDGECKEDECHVFRNIEKPDTDKEKLKPKLRWKYIKLDENGRLNQAIFLLKFLLPAKNTDEYQFRLHSTSGYDKILSSGFNETENPQKVTLCFEQIIEEGEYTLQQVGCKDCIFEAKPVSYLFEAEEKSKAPETTLMDGPDQQKRFVDQTWDSAHA